ncbi:hypothetical protein O7635_22605 [Asanoa sp. WMMD1127]|uniref:hypothetical protein n=1 Tax=Asanoa sp. WMMD1127 TaxID=3016107 RepID=UPI002417C132|nr:hypothetical protein [Asanoa sp. WMMD1127]MDG4824651.1 hypothetical protein [Asanoa sp. WMMD1127]
MSGQLTKRLALMAALLVVGSAITVSTMFGPNDVARRGSAIRETDPGTISVRNPRVGDVVMFHMDMPDIKDGKAIRVTEVAAPDNDLKLLGARVYHRRDFGGAALLGWQTSNGGDQDPHQQPSTDLVGATLSGKRNPERFVLFEFTVGAAGNHAIERIDIRYESASTTYQQSLKVSFEVRDALPDS